MPKSFVLLLLLLGLSGCGGEDALNVGEFADACQDASDWTLTECTCMAERIKADLPEPAMRYLYVKFDQGEQAANALRELSLQETTQASMQLVSAGTSCSINNN